MRFLAKVVGRSEITSKNGNMYRIVYITYEDAFIEGYHAASAFIRGNSMPEVGEEVDCMRIGKYISLIDY